jgi:hypothetical protein
MTEEQLNAMQASSVRYRDLMMFEERLKQNMIRLKKRQQKYEGERLTAQSFPLYAQTETRMVVVVCCMVKSG